MSVKYRIRLQNERVIGPFTTEEIAELYLKKHITGDEVAQQFPIGDWRGIKTFPALSSIVQEIKHTQKSESEAKFAPDISKTPEKEKFIEAEVPHPGLKAFKEFKFGKNVKIDVDYDELEKKYNEENPESEIKQEDDLEKTRISRKLPVAPNSEEIEKTVVVPWKAAMPTKESTDVRNLKREEKKQKRIEAREEASSNLPTHQELVDGKTEFLNLAQILPTINAQLSVSEIELEQQARIEENNEKIRQKEYQDKLENEDESEESDHSDDENEIIDESDKKKPKKKRKKGMSIIMALAFMGIFYVLLMPEDKPKIVGPRFIDIKFPITQEYEEKSLASQALVQGRTLYAKGSYLNRVLAAQSFSLSLQKQFSSNEALGELILTYSELLEDSLDPKLAGNSIYKLIQLSENKMLSDLNIVTGTALFYGKIGKYQTGINLVKNYFRAKGPASTKLLAYYLDLLINNGDLVEARETFNKLKDISKKPFEAYNSLAHFYDVNEQSDLGLEIIEEGLKTYPSSALLLLKKADYYFKKQSPVIYEETLKKCDKINSEGSPTLSAKFYEHMGLLSALKNKNKEATIFFKKSLAIKESDELRKMLSSLEVSGDKFSKTLILESKAIDLIKKAKVEIKNKNLEAAFSFSIEAVDTYPDYIPGILLLTQMQLKRGLFDSAIDTLQKAISNNPTNAVLKKNLVMAYMQSFKFSDAQQTLIDLSQTKFAFGSEYATLMGDFYLAKNNLNLAVRWYSDALNRNPLSDYDMYQIAKINLRIKKFNDAKNRISKALLLDPKNPQYLALYSEILFEQDNTDTAIGYLRDSISEIGEDPTLVSAIAILYYKSGQLKEFQNYYKRISELPKKDEAFYEFLIYAAKLEDKKEDFISYSRELLKLNPGNLKVRLELGEFLFGLRRYPEAILEFEEVRGKLVSYPRVHFMLAKVYLATKDIVKAKAMALKELELNPTLDSAYFIVGEVARIEKDYREAIFKYEKAISLNPKSVDALMAMGTIRLAQNYASEAIELFNRAMKEDRNNPEIYKQMGLAYKAAGQRALAKEKLEDYLKISPGAPDREQIEAQIRILQ